MACLPALNWGPWQLGDPNNCHPNTAIRKVNIYGILRSLAHVMIFEYLIRYVCGRGEETYLFCRGFNKDSGIEVGKP